MGTSTMFDLVASFVIFGFVLLLVVMLNKTATYSTYSTTDDQTVQTNMTALTRLIESDFRKIGYSANPTYLPDPSLAILAAGQNNITFLADTGMGETQDTGMVDTVKYSIGDTTTCRRTQNPRDFLLYRQINSRPAQMFSIGLTEFNFVYYDAGDSVMPFPITIPAGSKSGIFLLRLSIILESPYAYDTTYSYSYWREIRLTARNLKHR